MNKTLLLPAALLLASWLEAGAQLPPVTLDPLPADSAAAVQAIPVSAMEQPVPQVPVEQGSRTVTLTREQCLAIALQENMTIKVADLEIQRMDISKKETRASLFPKIDFSAAYQRAIELQTISMNMGGQAQSFKMGSDNTWNFGFSASLPLVAPQLWKALQISDTQILANYETARASRLNLIDQINKAYYTLLLSKASYSVLKDNYEVARYNHEVYSKQFALGTATEYDVLRSSVEVKNLEPQLLQAQISIDQCRLQLRVLMGIAEDLVIEPDVTLAQMQRDMYDYVATLDRSLTGNTDLRSIDIQSRLAEQNVELKKKAFLPTLAAQFNLNWSALSNGNALKNQQFHPYSTVGLSLSMPLFAGGSRLYAMRQAEVQVKELKLQRENLVNSLEMQVQLAIENIDKEVRQIDTSAEGVRQAEKAHSIMQKSFEIGAATYLNLRDSELAETSSRLAYYQAIYNYLISTSELDLLLGRETELKNLGYSLPAPAAKK